MVAPLIQRDGKYQYHIIKIKTASKNFAEDLRSALLSLNMKAYICTSRTKKNPAYDVVVRNKDSFRKFMEEIKPQNKKSGDAGIRTQISTLPQTIAEKDLSVWSRLY